MLYVTFDTDRKINAIRDIRQYFSLGLKEAKDIVEGGANFDEVYRPYMEDLFTKIRQNLGTTGYFKFSISSGTRGGYTLTPTIANLDEFNARQEKMAPLATNAKPPTYDLGIIGVAITAQINTALHQMNTLVDSMRDSYVAAFNIQNSTIDTLATRVKELEEQVELLSACGAADSF